MDGAALLAADPGVKMKLLKVINVFKVSIETMQTTQK